MILQEPNLQGHPERIYKVLWWKSYLEGSSLLDYNNTYVKVRGGENGEFSV